MTSNTSNRVRSDGIATCRSGGVKQVTPANFWIIPRLKKRPETNKARRCSRAFEYWPAPQALVEVETTALALALGVTVPAAVLPEATSPMLTAATTATRPIIAVSLPIWAVLTPAGRPAGRGATSAASAMEALKARARTEDATTFMIQTPRVRRETRHKVLQAFVHCNIKNWRMDRERICVICPIPAKVALRRKHSRAMSLRSSRGKPSRAVANQ